MERPDVSCGKCSEDYDACQCNADYNELYAECENLRERLAQAEAERDELLNFGCQDGWCWLRGKAIGMHTNGGCHCLNDGSVPIGRQHDIRMALRSLHNDLARERADKERQLRERDEMLREAAIIIENNRWSCAQDDWLARYRAMELRADYERARIGYEGTLRLYSSPCEVIRAQQEVEYHFLPVVSALRWALEEITKYYEEELEDARAEARMWQEECAELRDVEDYKEAAYWRHVDHQIDSRRNGDWEAARFND